MHNLPPNPLISDTLQQTTQHNNDTHRYKQKDNNNDNDNQEQDNQEWRNEKWPQPNNDMKIIVDSKQLCDTLNGTAILDYNNKEDYHTCNNITNNILKLHKLGY